MKKIKYTFIIPAYNAEMTIENCLDNIIEDVKLNKEMKEQIEIIVVENGSNDNTKKVVDNYINKNKYNIKLVISEKGVSKARNEGIKNSKGDYIIFVDADDKWLKGSLNIISNDNKQKKDLYLYSFLKGKEQTIDEKCLKIEHILDKKLNIQDVKSWILSFPTRTMQVWAKVFKAKIIRDNNLFFNEKLKYSEDSEFLIRFINFCNEIGVSTFPIYKYIISEGSAMRSINPARIDGYIKSLEISKKIIIKENIQIRKSFDKYVLSHLNIILVHDVFVFKRGFSFVNDYKKMKKILNNIIFKESLNNVKLNECFNMILFPELFLKLHLGFFTAFACYFKSYLNNK